jgi:hypothetical protein
MRVWHKDVRKSLPVEPKGARELAHLDPNGSSIIVPKLQGLCTARGAESELVFTRFCTLRSSFLKVSSRSESGRSINRSGLCGYATPLANYAIRQVLAGRRVGTRFNVRDVTSLHARLRYRVIVERLDRFERDEGEWREVLVEDRRATPADIAAATIDLSAWFRSLSGRHRRIAKALAMGDTTSEAARRFGLSLARISQFRGELRANWEAFQGGGDVCAGQVTGA